MSNPDTIVWFVWRVYYCVQLLPEVMFFWFFFFFPLFPLPFPFLAKIFSFQSIFVLIYFIWISQKWPISQNIWCLIKTQLKNITQIIFQGGSPWATMIQNNVVCLEGTLLCPIAFLRPWFFDFFQSFPLPFPLLNFYFLIA